VTNGSIAVAIVQKCRQANFKIRSECFGHVIARTTAQMRHAGAGHHDGQATIHARDAVA
jgi:hypothetical protein